MVCKAGLVAVLLLAALLPFAAGSPVGADTHVVTREIPNVGFRFIPADLVVDVTGTLTLTNADLAGHDVVAVADGPEGNPWCGRFYTRACPLFASPIVGLAEQGEVLGLEALRASGPEAALFTFDYYCSVHPWMTGTITTI